MTQIRQIDADFLADVNIAVVIGCSLKYTASEFNAKTQRRRDAKTARRSRR